MILNFEKNLKIGKIGSLKKIWKFGKALEILEKFGNLEKFWKNLEIKKKNWKFGEE